MDFNKTLSFIVEYQLMGQRPWSWSSETWSLLRNHEFAMLNTEVSLIVVPDFTICVYGSSCKYLFILVLFSLLFFLYLFCVVPSFLGDDNNKKENANEREKGRTRDNYMNCCTQIRYSKIT